MRIQLGSRTYTPQPTDELGAGGEAVVYDLHDGTALKLYRGPDDPAYQGKPHEQRGARERLAQIEAKLRAFPQLDSRVVQPLQLAEDPSGRVVGYTMQALPQADMLLMYGSRNFRAGKVSQQQVQALYWTLSQLLHAVHPQAVIGDFNDRGVLVLGLIPYLIDADSLQFGSWQTRVFTEKFVDPQLVRQTLPQEQQAGLGTITLAKPHTRESDWYAFYCMLMEAFLYVGPWGGVLPPKAAGYVPSSLRALHGKWVLDPEVRYPKPALKPEILPDWLLDRFEATFLRGDRTPCNPDRLQGMQWRTCPACQTEYARPICPTCTQTTPAAVKSVTQVRGQVTATRTFRTHGHLLHATVQEGQLRWIYQEGLQFRKGDSSVSLQGTAQLGMRFRSQRGDLLLGKGQTVVRLRPDLSHQRYGVDLYRGLPVFDATADHLFWVEGGKLYREGRIAPEYLGDVLQNQTQFWVGRDLGFGYYQAGSILTGFTFRPSGWGIYNGVKLPPLPTQILDAHCLFSADLAWFFYSYQEGGQTLNRCVVLTGDGAVTNEAVVVAGSDHWLGHLRGHGALGLDLFTATDTGLLRISRDGQGGLQVTRTYPDTEPFTQTGQQVLPGPLGLYLVSGQEITLLKLQ
jgi:H/ACA ribonucleoprotein complex subunit 3